jgi:divalent metal cation (Fe/Co/Zn/Cd) transporter
MESFFTGLGIVGILLLIAALLLPIFALFDLYQKRHQTSGSTVLWVLIILMIPYLGSVLYFFFGRK